MISRSMQIRDIPVRGMKVRRENYCTRLTSVEPDLLDHFVVVRRDFCIVVLRNAFRMSISCQSRSQTGNQRYPLTAGSTRVLLRLIV